jgi:hypothetical protein
MNDDKKLNQPADNTNSDNYQKILDEAVASIKPKDTIEPEPTAELKEINPDIKPKEPEKLKDINSPQLEAPDDVQSIPADIPENKPEIANKELPKTDVQPDIEKHELPPVYDPPKENLEAQEEAPKSPEEVKAQIDEILANDSSNTDSSTEVPKKSSSFKSVFIFSLIIFFVIAGAWIYFLFFY